MSISMDHTFVLVNDCIFVKYLFLFAENMVVLSSFLPPQEGIRHEEPNTTLYINDREVGKGTFYITER